MLMAKDWEAVMELHVGRLYWPEVTEVSLNKEMNKESFNDTDILIVGAGMSGAISAYRLAQAGYRVTLIDQHTVASGSSSANTGLIQYMSDKGVMTLADEGNPWHAITLYNESVKAVKTLMAINEEVPEIETETFAVKSSLIMATEKNKVQTVKDEVRLQDELGYGAKYISEKDLAERGIQAYAALEASPDIAMNPYGFVYRLVNTAIEKYNLNVLEHVTFVDYTSTEDGVEVTVAKEAHSAIIRAKRILFATGYNPPKHLSKKLSNLEIFKSYVTVSDTNVRLNEDNDFLAWEVKDPYIYFRHTFENRLMIGGRDKKGDQLNLQDSDKNSERLVRDCQAMFTEDLGIETEYYYAALFGESKDDYPYMGVDPDDEKAFVICGVGGNGTIYSTIGSSIALEWMAGKDLSRYEMFRLGR